MPIKANKTKDESDIKVYATLLLLLMVLGMGSFISSSFPQNVLVNNASTFDYNDNIIAFQSITTEGAVLTINAKQAQASPYDTVAMGGRESLTLTGHQIVHNGDTFYNAFLTIPTRLNHVALFEQSTLSIPDSSESFEISYLDDIITVTSMNNNVYQITSGANNYNIFLPDQKTTYITDADNRGFYKLSHKNDKIFVTLVGIYTAGELNITVVKS